MNKFLFCLPMLLLSGCSISPSPSPSIYYSYYDFSYLEITYENMFKQDDDSYFVYIYSRSCSHCEAIKDDVLSFVFSKSFPIYLIRYSKDIKISQEIDRTIGVDNTDDFYIAGTPTLVHIHGHKVINNIAGEKDILYYLSLYRY